MKLPRPPWTSSLPTCGKPSGRYGLAQKLKLEWLNWKVISTLDGAWAHVEVLPKKYIWS